MPLIGLRGQTRGPASYLAADQAQPHTPPGVFSAAGYVSHGVGEEPRALSRCQIEHETNRLACRVHAAATTSRHVCTADALITLV